MPDRSTTHFTPIRLIEDQPIDDLEHDHLGLMPWAKMIASATTGTRGPFTIGVHGEWGYGKTTLLKLTQRLIEKHQKDVVTVWFNAWQFEREEHPLFPLIAAIADEIGAKRRIPKAVAQVGASVRGIAHGMKLSGEIGLPGALKVGAEFDAQKAIEEEKRILEQQANPLQGETMYRQAFKALEKATSRVMKTQIAVFIDDLDRCHPNKAIFLLESVKLILSQPGFVFVLAVDDKLIRSYLQKRYAGFCGEKERNWGQFYLDKIIQLPIHIPSHRSRFEGYVERVVNDLEAHYKAKSPQMKALVGVHKVLAMGADNNPRSLVRLVNNFLLDCYLWPLIDREGDEQLRQYHELSDDIAAALAFNRILERALGDLYEDLIHDQDLCIAILMDRLEDYQGKDELSEPEQRPAPSLAQGEEDLPWYAVRQAMLARKELLDALRQYGGAWLSQEGLRVAVHEFSQTQRALGSSADLPEPIAAAIRRELMLEEGEPILADHLKDVERLNLSHTHVADAELAHLKDLSRLHWLHLGGTQVTDRGLAHLKDLSALRQLHLLGTRVTDAGLAHLRGLSELQLLDLYETGVTDDGLAHLRGLSGLQWLGLIKTRVTDYGLLHLKGLSGLQFLDLSHTQVTDEGLVHVKDLSRLNTLLIADTRVTDEGLAKLRKERPDMEVLR